MHFRQSDGSGGLVPTLIHDRRNRDRARTLSPQRWSSEDCASRGGGQPIDPTCLSFSGAVLVCTEEHVLDSGRALLVACLPLNSRMPSVMGRPQGGAVRRGHTGRLRAPGGRAGWLGPPSSPALGDASSHFPLTRYGYQGLAARYHPAVLAATWLCGRCHFRSRQCCRAPLCYIDHERKRIYINSS